MFKVTVLMTYYRPETIDKLLDEGNVRSGEIEVSGVVKGLARHNHGFSGLLENNGRSLLIYAVERDHRYLRSIMMVEGKLKSSYYKGHEIYVMGKYLNGEGLEVDAVSSGNERIEI